MAARLPAFGCSMPSGIPSCPPNCPPSRTRRSPPSSGLPCARCAEVLELPSLALPCAEAHWPPCLCHVLFRLHPARLGPTLLCKATACQKALHSWARQRDCSRTLRGTAMRESNNATSLEPAKAAPRHNFRPSPRLARPPLCPARGSGIGMLQHHWNVTLPKFNLLSGGRA